MSNYYCGHPAPNGAEPTPGQICELCRTGKVAEKTNQPNPEFGKWPPGFKHPGFKGRPPFGSGATTGHDVAVLDKMLEKGIPFNLKNEAEKLADRFVYDEAFVPVHIGEWDKPNEGGDALPDSIFKTPPPPREGVRDMRQYAKIGDFWRALERDTAFHRSAYYPENFIKSLFESIVPPEKAAQFLHECEFQSMEGMLLAELLRVREGAPSHDRGLYSEAIIDALLGPKGNPESDRARAVLWLKRVVALLEANRPKPQWGRSPFQSFIQSQKADELRKRWLETWPAAKEYLDKLQVKITEVEAESRPLKTGIKMDTVTHRMIRPPDHQPAVTTPVEEEKTASSCATSYLYIDEEPKQADGPAKFVDISGRDLCEDCCKEAKHEGKCCPGWAHYNATTLPDGRVMSDIQDCCSECCEVNHVVDTALTMMDLHDQQCQFCKLTAPTDQEFHAAKRYPSEDIRKYYRVTKDPMREKDLLP